jgi:hypothetical protein
VTHPDVEQVADLLGGLLPRAEARRVRDHLAGCAECARVARQVEDVTAALHAEAQVTPRVPDDVARRLDAALAAEVHERATAAEADEAEGGVTRDEVYAGSGVTSLAQRRVRRRRAMAGGLLAAAAVTVAAVGLGGMLGSGGSSQLESAAGGSTETAAQDAASQHPGAFSSSSRAPGTPTGPDVALEQDRSDEAFGAAELGNLRERSLIAAVAGRHVPGSTHLDHPDCVRSALGAGADAGSVASYAVRLPQPGRGRAGTPAAVVLRPLTAPTEGLLVACSPQPHVVLRRGLGP